MLTFSQLSRIPYDLGLSYSLVPAPYLQWQGGRIHRVTGTFKIWIINKEAWNYIIVQTFPRKINNPMFNRSCSFPKYHNKGTHVHHIASYDIHNLYISASNTLLLLVRRINTNAHFAISIAATMIEVELLCIFSGHFEKKTGYFIITRGQV